MHAVEDMPRRTVGRGRVAAVVGVVVLIVLITSMRGIARFYTDFLWFDSLEMGEVFKRVFFTKVALFLTFTTGFALILYLNMFIADLLAPRVRPQGPEEEVLQPFHDFVSGRQNLLRVGTAILLSLFASAGVGSQWQSWLLFRNRVDFGIRDPQFDKDVGFYVFQMPFLTFLVAWMFAALLLLFIATAVTHYLNGGIRVQVLGERISPQVKAHLSLLLALMALTKALGYWLDRFELTLSTDGFVDGASYTEVNAQLPAIQLLMLISFFACLALVVNIWLKGITIPALAVGLWALVAVVAAGIYPVFVQRFTVEPSESANEAPYIERNIAATRFALNLNGVAERVFEYEAILTAESVADNSVTLDNVRLLDPAVISDTFNQKQAIKGFYEFTDIDVDRYFIDGKLTQVVLGARELVPSKLNNKSWESSRVSNTHGYGITVAPANGVDEDGQPDYILRDVPPVATVDDSIFDLDQAGIYYGEELGGFAIVGAERDEIDYQTADNEDVTTRYDGSGGVETGSLLRKLAFALRFGDINLVISSQLTDESRILYNRKVTERVTDLAPFLSLDSDPYPVIIDGRIKWVLDAYTTTSRFPYANQVDSSALSFDSGLRHSFNYVRNSVKAVVDAYDGSVVLYVIDESDPIILAYRKIFPELFSDVGPSPELEAHFRYPEDLFEVQTHMWGWYRITDPSEFYDSSDRWLVSEDPDETLKDTTATTIAGESDGEVVSTKGRIDAQYLLMKLPGDEDESFIIFRPFVPFSRDDTRRTLQGFMVARSDPGHYGELESFQVVSPTLEVDGPGLVASNIQTEPDISEKLTLIGQGGSQIEASSLVIVPVDQTLVYVWPIFLSASGAAPVPELQLVVVAVGKNIALAETFEEALQKVVDGDIGISIEDLPPIENADATTLAILQEAINAFSEAEQALGDGDLGLYQEKVQQAQDLLQQALNREQSLNAPDETTTTTASST